VTPDQQSLVELADQILRGRTSNEQLAAVEASETRVDDRLWSELAEAGLLGIAVPEEHGGAGLGLTEVCLLLEQLGRRVAPVPLWETAVAALGIAELGSAAHRQRWLPGVAAGSTRLSLAVDLTGSGPARLVPSGHVADAVVVITPNGVFLAEGLGGTVVQTLMRALATQVALPEPPGEQLAGPDGVERLADAARVGLAAGMLGTADEGVREAASYLSAREQFGRPLATFQAVSQQLGDAYCDVQAMRATLWQAVWALEQGGAARREVDVATWWACDAGVRVQTLVQHLHGGIGADTTYPVHRRLLWALQTDALLGGASRQLARLGPALVPAS
jgi:alkylation response protein AidB-like acyl-CoA dehydrogenase